MTAPAVATILSCPNCGHAHTEEAWAYQSGYCHACGEKLDLPVAPDPRAASYSGWTAGPHPRAGILLEREQAVEALIKTQVAQDPPTTPPVQPPPGSFAAPAPTP